jgi:hypothetical protein
MCAIIDTCVFSVVFNSKMTGHARFAPLLKWITEGKGKIVVGGKKYFSEIEGKKSFGLLAEFERARLLVRLKDEEVDKFAAQLKKKNPEPQLDDEHLVAMVAVSKCCVVCTDDKKAIPYLKDAELYPSGVKPPKIYCKKSHGKSLCIDDHIAKICK